MVLTDLFDKISVYDKIISKNGKNNPINRSIINPFYKKFLVKMIDNDFERPSYII